MHIDQQYLMLAFQEGPVGAEWPSSLRLFRAEMGKLSLSTGQLVACDPFVSPDAPAFTRTFPAGEYPIFLTVADLGNDQRVAFAVVQISQGIPVTWSLLTICNQDPNTLKKDEYFGYPVDSGTGAFMDRATAALLDTRMTNDSTYSESISAEMEKRYVNTWDWAEVVPGADLSRNAFVFHSGYGDGVYPTFLGTGSSQDSVAVVTDFQVFELRSANGNVRS